MQFNIPKPCSADWDQMLPTDRGKHCALCKKEVLDLTQSSTEEIRNTLKEEKQTPCVKIESKQLTTLNTTKLSLKPLLRAAVAALISGLIIVPPNKIIAQELDYNFIRRNDYQPGNRSA